MTPGLIADQVACRVHGRALLHPQSFTLQPGSLTAIVGPNGAGKSTLLSLLSGQRRPTTGQVWLDGRELAQHELQMLARHRAVMAQDTSIAFDFRVRDVAELGRYPHRLHPSADEAGIVSAALAATGVAGLAQRSITTLSGGERARAQLARVLAQIWHPPPEGGSRWLLLDEPTAALDLHHQHEVLRLARQWAQGQGVGVVAVLHDLNLALRYADHVLVLEQGRLVAQGAPCDTLDDALLQRVWRVGTHRTTLSDGTPQLLVA